MRESHTLIESYKKFSTENIAKTTSDTSKNTTFSKKESEALKSTL